MPPRVLAVALLAQVLGGLTPVWTKLALEGLPPWTLVFARQASGSYSCSRSRASGAGRRRAAAPWTARDIGLLLLISWGGFALPQVLLATGAERSTAVAYALLTPLEPIGIVIGGALWLSEGLPRARAIALVLGTLGASLVVLQDGLRPDLGDAFGDVLMAAGHLAWAIYTLGAKSLLERHDEGRVSLAAVALTLPPLALLAGTESIDPARAVPALLWVFVLAASLDRARHVAVELGAAPHARGHDGRADLRAAAGGSFREHARARRAHRRARADGRGADPRRCRARGAAEGLNAARELPMTTVHGHWAPGFEGVARRSP